MSMDFTPRPSVEWSENFERLIDVAMQADNEAQPKRGYIGASRVGEECVRKLVYEFQLTPKDEGRNFQGKTLRIFDMGHDSETRMASYIRLAGFNLLTERQDSKQFGFAVAWSEEKQCFQFSGHCDGIITAAPYDSGLAVPALWENKALGNKSWNDTIKKGVRASKPIYFAQMQLYMAYLEVNDNPGLFTALNRDTGQIYAERVPFDAKAAQDASDKGVKVVTAQSPNDFPRIAREPTDFRCKFCDYQARCWATPAASTEPVAVPTWMGGIALPHLQDRG